jgi:copper homeostasis protein
MAKWSLEICVDNIEAAIAAEKAGADRIELCANLNEGGTTPSYAMIHSTLDNLTIPVFPIIRPRGGDFFYSEKEFEIMIQDAIICMSSDCAGIAVGLLKTNGTVDIKRTKYFVSLMDEKEVTFHRAFDRAKDPFQALEDIIETGCKRILTSGLQPTAEAGMGLIAKLVEKANGRIIIMPGAGVRSNNIEKILTTTKAIEYHSSAKKMMQSDMKYFNPNFNKQENNFQGVDVEEIRKMKVLIS